MATTKTPRRRFVSLAGRITRNACRLTLHLPQDWTWQNQSSYALERLRALPLRSWTRPRRRPVHRITQLPRQR